MVSPEGGPKDLTPPTVKDYDPPNNSTQFTGKTIRIDFDEFINIESSGNKILVSPPLDEAPDYRLRGKSLLVVFQSPLRPEKTYNIDFGSAVSDITENNKMTGLRYAFSTGNTLDSMVLNGRVIDAFTTLPAKEVLVMLYNPHNDTVPSDSLPLRVKPDYLTRTTENGGFVLTNLAPGAYKLFALADKTGDMLYNIAGEQIAFADTLVMPWYERPSVTDTAMADSTAQDSTRIDSVTARHESHSVQLRLFEPKDSTQSLDKSNLLRDRMAVLVFRYPAVNLRIVPLNADSTAPWYLAEWGKAGDTLTLWLNGTLPDTLHLKVSADKMKNDTIDMPVKYREPEKKARKAEEEKPKPLDITFNSRGGVINQFKTSLILTTSYPLVRMDFSSVRLIAGKDTLTPEMEIMDSIHRNILIRHKWTEGGSYQLIIPAGTFQSFNGLVNDTVRTRFKAAESRAFGNLKINLEIPEGIPQVVVQLLNDNDKVLEEQVINKTGRMSFDYLLPAKYKLKVVLDRNMNRRWDTGDYFHNIQPETVICFPRTLDIRANWDVEETWSL